MRISDWSSDVCSSDLPRACQKSKPESCQPARDRGPVRGHRRAVRSGAECCALPAIVTHCEARIAMSRLAPFVGPANRPGPEGRSEEHTSELQSPMRISYAVFCLKNTQKNNNT